jgi:hypothetical protein
MEHKCGSCPERMYCLTHDTTLCEIAMMEQINSEYYSEMQREQEEAENYQQAQREQEEIERHNRDNEYTPY